MTTNKSMKCPHCLVGFYVRPYHSGYQPFPLGEDIDGFWWVEDEKCPNCGKVTVWLLVSSDMVKAGPSAGLARPLGGEQRTIIRPKTSGRPPVPTEVPEEFAEDYREACLVLADSPKASAALSRRCLQHILREKAHVKHPNNLADAIKEVLDDPKVLTEIAESLDAVRNIGNFSAHPNKSQNTGEIVDVEPGEAEWCLETIEILFGHYFVRPADIQRRRQALDNKLADTGKPTMAGPPAS